MEVPNLLDKGLGERLLGNRLARQQSLGERQRVKARLCPARLGTLLPSVSIWNYRAGVMRTYHGLDRKVRTPVLMEGCFHKALNYMRACEVTEASGVVVSNVVWKTSVPVQERV